MQDWIFHFIDQNIVQAYLFFVLVLRDPLLPWFSIYSILQIACISLCPKSKIQEPWLLYDWNLAKLWPLQHHHISDYTSKKPLMWWKGRWKGHILTLIPISLWPLLGSKVRQVSSNWLLWNWGQHFKSLTAVASKGRMNTWLGCLLARYGCLGATNSQCKSPFPLILVGLQGGRDPWRPTRMRSGGAVFLAASGFLSSPPLQKVAGSSMCHPRELWRRRLHWSFPEAHEERTDASLYYMWKEKLTQIPASKVGLAGGYLRLKSLFLSEVSGS